MEPLYPKPQPRVRIRNNSEGPEPADGDPSFEMPRERIRVGAEFSPRPFDWWALGEILLRRWRWVLFGGLVLAGAGFQLGLMLCQRHYTAVAQLIRFETPSTGDYFKPPQLTPETFAMLLRSPELLQQVSTQAQPPLTPNQLAKNLRVEPEVNSDIVKVSLSARDEREAIALVNLYLREAVRFAREMQSKQFAELSSNYLQQELKAMDQDILVLQEKFRALPPSAPIGQLSNLLTQVGSDVKQLQASPLLVAKMNERLQNAIADLSELMTKYTEAHPSVIAAQERVKSLKDQVAQAAANAPKPVTPLPELVAPGQVQPEVEIIRTKLHSLEDSRQQLAGRAREAQLYADNPPGNVRLFALATQKSVSSNWRWLKISLLAAFMGMVGMAGTAGLILLGEVMDDRLKTAADVKRVTRLPVLAALSDLGKVEPTTRAKWAFRTWTMLQGRLSPSANHGLVCGITSSVEGEGRSTWINLLAEAASMAGFRVLTIATRPSPAHVDELEEGEGDENATNGSPNGNHTEALTTNVLSSPAQVTEKLIGPDSQPMVHIPLPGWVWDLERRKQWREALQHWRQIDNLVILVELPPASITEAVLLGSNLPNLIWLTDSGVAEAAETRSQLETLRHARCNLVGAVLNHEPARPIKRRFSRWIGCLAFGLGLCAVHAQPSGVSPLPPSTSVAETNLSFSVTSARRAPWQQRLTLGPGDVLNFALFEHPELAHTEVAIGPDGYVSFLEAQSILATGLTIDELRAKFDEALGKYRRAPRTMITPVAFKSKKYFILGKVMQKGVYTLDRPLTILEAVARAKGLETSLADRNSVDLADFQRSFLARGGKRIPLDFENLFQNGDLSQNIAIEPGDYIFFPPGNLKEVYVLGEVRLPGPVTYTAETTVIAAISGRAGFTDRAFKSRVLVVRGSLSNPETFIVNTMAILEARAPDFKLQPKDIIYVSSRPFIKVEELIDLAATAFIQAAITGWVGERIIKP